MRIFQKLNVYQKNTSNPVQQSTYIVKTTRENKEERISAFAEIINF